MGEIGTEPRRVEIMPGRTAPVRQPTTEPSTPSTPAPAREPEKVPS